MRSSDTVLDAELRAEYAVATLEFAADPDVALWESTVGDGLDKLERNQDY